MGGDAFPSTARLTESEYARLTEQIAAALSSAGVQFAFPPEVADKAAVCAARGKARPYGDVDVLVGRELAGGRALVEAVKAAVGNLAGEEKHNDCTVSFLSAERYQVDLLFCQPDHLQFLLAFKANNDFGALLGHLLTPLELKWSHAGLALKLRLGGVAGLGAAKFDFPLTADPAQVCRFLGLPAAALDGVTRLSCQQIFNILTSSRVFFSTEYDEKYKIRERRKRRPVSDEFFTLLESFGEDLAAQKNNMYRDDELEEIFSNFRSRRLTYEDYVPLIAEQFNVKAEIQQKLRTMKETYDLRNKQNEKFNFYILSSWLPDQVPFIFMSS